MEKAHKVLRFQISELDVSMNLCDDHVEKIKASDSYEVSILNIDQVLVALSK